MNKINNYISYDYKDIVPCLLNWYNANARELPWRQNPMPYHVWISEIMLQQTRVEAVKGYYDRFLATLPTIEDLANAPEDVLMKLWEGLGYYTRVRNLQKAAKLIVTDYNGELPSSYNELLKLPGIGTYTAGAIASIAYGISVAAVDGNVLRIAKRVAGSFEDIMKASVKKQLEIDFNAIMPDKEAGAFNQSLMDLGATICIPNGKPLCEQCPINHLCEAYKKNIQARIPVKSKKKARRIEKRTVFVIEFDKKYVLHKRMDKGLLGGMWELPNIEGNFNMDILQGYENDKIRITSLGEAKHIFSHVEWHMIGIHMIFTHSDLMEEFCGQMFKNTETHVDNNNSMDKSKNNIQVNEQEIYHIKPRKISCFSKNEFSLVDKDNLKNSYALPTAFETYKIWK